jgi:3-dehydroquinate synthase
VSESFNFSIVTSDGGYNVAVGNGIFCAHDRSTQEVWLVDSNVARLHHNILPLDYIQQEAVESQKNLDSIAKIIEKIRIYGGIRSTRLVGVGGGIVQDLATFAASCYMRGIKWRYYPTTLLSMVDSCIGGKSSINAGQYKNIIGNFYPPQEVVIDTRFCNTLTDEQMIEGLCESVKICYADSDESFKYYLTLIDGGEMPPRDDRLVRVIHHSLWIKKRFIEEDEFDQGIRLLLNFGHTFGHAIEGASSYAISHGIAVGLGMLAAEYCSIRLGFADADLTNMTSLSAHVRRLLKIIPTVAENLWLIEPETALACFLSDKKHSAESFTLILFDKQGRLQRVKVPRSDEVKAEIITVFEYLRNQFHEIQ